MADDVMALLNEDDGMILALEAQLREVQSSIDNIMKAIEKGVVTRTTKIRLEELEAEEEKIKWNIKAEEDKRPKITKDFILFTLHKFRNLDLRFEKNKERLIDGLVKAIFVYDDYIKLILTFDDKPINIPTSDEIENMANSSDIQSNVSPKKETHTIRCVFLFLTARRAVSNPLGREAFEYGFAFEPKAVGELAHQRLGEKYSPKANTLLLIQLNLP